MKKAAMFVMAGAMSLALSGCVTINMPAESSSAPAESEASESAPAEKADASSEASLKTAEFMGFTMDVPSHWTLKDMDSGTMYTADGEDAQKNNYISVTYLEPNHGATFESIEFFFEDSEYDAGSTIYSDVESEEIDGVPFMSATETVKDASGNVLREGKKACFVTERGDLTNVVVYCDEDGLSGYPDQAIASIKLT